MAIGPPRSSTRMSAGVAWTLGNCTGTNAAATALVEALTDVPPPRRSASTTQRRAKFALMPWASATAALDTPGTLIAARGRAAQPAMACALAAASWGRAGEAAQSGIGQMFCANWPFGPCAKS